MREITEHELALITGQSEPTDDELCYYGFDAGEWARKARSVFTRAMEDGLEPEERAQRVWDWAEHQRERNDARVAAYRSCTKSIWARIARGEIRDPFVEVMKFQGPLGRG